MDKEFLLHKDDIDSYTPLAIQRNWKTPNAFPSCPDKISHQPLMDYLEQLKKHSIFSHNRFGESVVELATINNDKTFLGILTKIYGGVKGWGLVKISCEDGRFIHAAHGTYFSYEGAMKAYSGLKGEVQEHRDSIDDYC